MLSIEKEYISTQSQRNMITDRMNKLEKGGLYKIPDGAPSKDINLFGKVDIGKSEYISNFDIISLFTSFDYDNLTPSDDIISGYDNIADNLYKKSNFEDFKTEFRKKENDKFVLKNETDNKDKTQHQTKMT